MNIETIIELRAEIKSLKEKFDIAWEGISKVLQEHSDRLDKLEKPKSEMYYPDTQPN